VNFTASGTHRLRLTASDGAITTFDDTTATVTSMSPLQAWRQQNFGTQENTGNAADDADPDLDGYSNRVEYGTGTSPTAQNSHPLQMSMNGGQFVLQFNRWPNRTDATLVLESLSDLAGTPTSVARSQNGAPFIALAPGLQISESGTGPVTVTATVDVAPQNPHQFFRIKVEVEQ
jgi:hypothetical protein